MVFVCSSIPVALLDTLEIAKCLSMLYPLSPHLCFVIGGFMDELDHHADRTSMFPTALEADGEGWDLIS